MNRLPTNSISEPLEQAPAPLDWRIERLTALMDEDWLVGEWDAGRQLITPRPGGRLTRVRRCVVADCVGQYRLLKKLADYDPDPATGQNRKISLTYRMEAVPAYLATEDGKIIGTSTTAGLGGKVQSAFASNAGSSQTPTAAQ